MSKHTPGPWNAEDSEFGEKTARQIVEDSATTGHGAAISIKCILSGDGMFRTIADVGGIYRDSKRQLEEEEANARLIAAAPELLEALRELADLVDAMRNGEYGPDSFTTQPAHAAIAKAEGQQ